MNIRNIIVLCFFMFFILLPTRSEKISPVILPSPQICVVHHDFCNYSTLVSIKFILDLTIPSEGYKLEVRKNGIIISHSDDNGKIYAQQTLKMLCLQYEKSKKIPCIEIKDSPRLKWRSFVMDTGPCFRTIATLKKYIDVLSLLKFNIFQINLTDGLGWRIEIKKYPRLATIGGFPDTKEGRSGYYTQDELIDLVAYAKSKAITIVPCINSPGHSEAAQVAYPHLNCFDNVPIIPENGFTKNIFCVGKDETLQFMKDVLDEVCSIFPSKYIHLGGDEAPKENWQKCPKCNKRLNDLSLNSYHALQLWYSSQLANYLKEKGRKAIFWGDVVYEDGFDLPDNAVIHWWNWRGHKDLAYNQALKKGLEVICGTNYYTYLNFPVMPWAGYDKDRTFDLKDVYNNNPSYFPVNNSLVLGMSTCIWGDYTVYERMIDSRVFPRIFALIQQMWFTGKPMPFDSFYEQIIFLKPIFERLGYEFGPGLRNDVVK